MGHRAFSEIPQRRAIRAFSVGRDTVIFPGFDGGAEWGAQPSIREPAILYVNANEMAWTERWRLTLEKTVPRLCT